MHRNRLFWGLVLILLGTLFLLQTMGVLAWSVWAYFWPLVLILLGAWILRAPTGSGKKRPSKQKRLPSLCRALLKPPWSSIMVRAGCWSVMELRLINCWRAPLWAVSTIPSRKKARWRGSS